MTKIITTSRSFEKMPKIVYAAYTTEYLVMYWSSKKVSTCCSLWE